MNAELVNPIGKGVLLAMESAISSTENSMHQKGRKLNFAYDRSFHLLLRFLSSEAPFLVLKIAKLKMIVVSFASIKAKMR